MEEKRMKEKIIVSSDKDAIIEWSVVGGILLMVMIGLIIYLIGEGGQKSVAAAIYVAVVIPCIIAIIIVECLGIGRKIVMNQEGCHISFDCYFYHYQKFYRWDELQTKRYDKGYGKFYPRGRYASIYAPCYEGVVFSVAPIEKDNIYFKEDSEKSSYDKDKTPWGYCMEHPYTTFFVRFYTYGVSEGNGDYRSQVQAVKEYKKRKHTPGEKKPKVTRGPEVYPVEKEKFLACMDLWHVEIEGLTEMDRIMYAEESLEIDKFHP